MKTFRYLMLSLCFLVGGISLVGCSDEPDSENFYTFTGEMMSDYLKSRSQYSSFTQVVERAHMMDLLSAYGHYTLFLPTDSAFSDYLSQKNRLYVDRDIKSVNDLTDAECDTIARTHLVNNMYTTIEMIDGTLHTPNMNRRYIQITHELDENLNSVVVLNRSAKIYFALQDDSVENGVVHPIDKVLENTNSSVGQIVEDNPDVSFFAEALKVTGLVDSLEYIKDDSYDAAAYPKYTYTSDFWKEVAKVPEDKYKGFTVFVVTNEILKQKYGITSENSLKQLYDLACQLYDPAYPDDVNQPYHAFNTTLEDGTNSLTHRKNPLNRFVAYHILTRDVKGYDYLTPLVLTQNYYKGAIGIKTDKMNPNDWYETLMPHSMMKIEQLTVRGEGGAFLGQTGVLNERYANRRYDDKYQIEGAQILPTIPSQYVQDAPNGRYFYVTDVIAYDKKTREEVMNCRIRMDFSTVFPEIMTQGIRLNGDPTQDDNSGTPDYNGKNGFNYYFPDGYLDGVSMRGNCYFVYRRPHWNFWSYEGDEFNLFGDYDFSFRLPPVPCKGTYQFRLGFCALPTRGVAQIYYDGKPQGIPVDMRKFLTDPSIMGDQFKPDGKNYTDFTEEEKVEDQKFLKNKGCYRGAYGGYHTSGGSTINEFVNNERTFRRVLCTATIDPDDGTDHYIRIRCTSTSKLGNNNEFMIDYLEIVPKSVYAVDGEGEMEDDL